MGFEDFLELGDEKGGDVVGDGEGERIEEVEKIGQTQFYGIITGNKPDWQSIIYELIHTEQLDPWDVDIVVLTQKYFEKIHEIGEEDNVDFYVSSKVLLAASLLLRIKSEFLLNRSVQSIDDILFGRKEDNKPIIERIVVDEDDLPMLIPKTPLPRARRVTLPELMLALNKAINTESRRIKREVTLKRAKRMTEINLPEFRRIDLRDRIKQFYASVLTGIKGKGSGNDRASNKIGYNDFIGKEREEKVACFLPLLYLGNTQKLWLEQERHLDEIWIYLHKYFLDNPDKFLDREDELMESVDDEEGVENVEGEQLSGLEKARVLRDEKKNMAEEIAKELAEEIGVVELDEKIEGISGFEDEL